MHDLKIKSNMLSKIPKDLNIALQNNINAKKQWDTITLIAKMDFIRWISSAKLETTRNKRIQIACSKLISGDKRPCCYSTFPLDLYSLLNNSPKAKSNWSKLDPIEKRKLVYWIDLSDNQKKRKQNLVKACVILENISK